MRAYTEGMSATTMTDIPVHLEALRNTFQQGTTKPLSWRRNQLEQLDRMLDEREADFERALNEDVGKHAVESQLTEIGFLRSEIAHALKHLRSWARRKRVSVPPVVLPASAWVTPQPLGLVLIIAPWNYPLMLALSPLIGAIAAGNTAVVKPSEISSATSRTLARIVPEYLDIRAVRVIEGGVEETTELLKHRFDHIFFTGNGTVGRIVARAAAEHLTPVTLELGGKSPLFIDDTVDLAQAARRIVWAKFLNCGQSCVAPDYVLATPEVLVELETALPDAIYELYGNAIDRNPDYGRIVSEPHFERLVSYLTDGRIVTGGSHDRDTRLIEPTILADVPRDAAVMREEIFGPILPLVAITGVTDAIEVVRSRPHPLSVYVFSQDPDVRRRWEAETTSGALTYGAPVMHLSIPDLPFGGVGESGMGAYHGQRSFDTFSHHRAVLAKPLRPDTLGPTVMPPFTKTKEGLVRNLLRKLR